jgi:DNA-binding transcriptional LysR family regulator
LTYSVSRLPLNTVVRGASNPARMSTDSSWVGLEIRHLAALEAVAREGSFRAAAHRLGYVQSAISHQIVALERVVGTTLVQRTRGSRRSALTPAGEAVLEHATAILARVRAAEADLAAITLGRDAVFRLGTFQNLAAALVTPILPQLRRAASAGTIVFVEHDTGHDMQALVREGRADVAFTDLPINQPGLAYADLLDDAYVALVPEGSLAARRGQPLALEQIAQSELIAHGPTRSRVENELAARGLRPRVRLRTDNNVTVHALVAASVGYAVLPRLAAVASAGVKILPLAPEDAIPPRRLALTWESERSGSPELSTFVAAVVQHAQRVSAALASAGPEARRRASPR